MPAIELSDQQVVDLIRQLPPGPKLEALFALADGALKREHRRQYAEDQLKKLALERGLDWSKMSPDERESFIDDLVHEDRPCRT